MKKVLWSRIWKYWGERDKKTERKWETTKSHSISISSITWNSLIRSDAFSVCSTSPVPFNCSQNCLIGRKILSNLSQEAFLWYFPKQSKCFVTITPKLDRTNLILCGLNTHFDDFNIIYEFTLSFFLVFRSKIFLNVSIPICLSRNYMPWLYEI